MKRWRLAALLCFVALASNRGIAETSAYATPPLTPSMTGSGALLRTSEKSRAIARKLDATGYYSRYSRALKGYPHLRSKRGTGRTKSVRRVNAENRTRFRSYVQEVARKYSLDPKLIDAVIVVESAYDPNAVSRKGAMGLMQLMSDTAKRFNVSDPFNPKSNIQGGAKYLRWLMNRFDNDLALVLASYNAGEGAVAEHGGQIPPYEETQAYVKQVLSQYKR